MDVAQGLMPPLPLSFVLLDFDASYDHVLLKIDELYAEDETTRSIPEPGPSRFAGFLFPAPRAVVKYAKPHNSVRCPVKMHGLGRPLPPKHCLHARGCAVAVFEGGLSSKCALLPKPSSCKHNKS